MKALLISLYTKTMKSYDNWRYFKRPNYFTKVSLTYKNTPRCQQLTEITGCGKVTIGENCGFGYRIGGFWRKGSVEIQVRYKKATVEIGNKVFTNNNIFICAANFIKVGDNTRIGQGVMITDFEAHGTDPINRSLVGEIGSVVIGENVWIGNGAIILKNSKIGDNSIIAAGSLVNGEFPDNVIIGGVPARTIKKI